MSNYVMNEDDLWGLVAQLGVKTKVHSEEVQFEYCPYCHGGSKGDKWKFGINRKTGAFGCFKGGCKRQGHFVELCRDMGYDLELNGNEYARFPQPSEERKIIPNDAALAYLKARGIGEEVAKQYNVTAFENKSNVLWLPLFDENNKLVGAKERRMDWKETSKFPKEKWTKNSKQILFGMSQCVDFESLVITEGLIDAMSVAQAGIKNACSVPGGMNNDKWIALCREWVEKFKEIIVFGDLENDKISLVKDITQRLNVAVRVVRKQDYLGKKDANEILREFGEENVRKCVEQAQKIEVNHVIDLADVPDENPLDMPKVKTGITELDKALKGGICFGQVVLLSGKRGEGKSTFMSQLLCDALDQGLNTFVYSGELPNSNFKSWLNYQLAGIENMKSRMNEFGEPEWYLEKETSKRISEWYRGRAFIFDTESIGGDELVDLVTTIKRVIIQNAVKFICIDNLMTAMDVVESQNELYMAQGKFVSNLKQIAKAYNVAIVLVAHLRKAGKDQQGTDAFDNDAVSGSADITNRVDIILNYSKAKETETEFDSRLQIGKNRLAGVLKLGDNAIKLVYSPKTKRVYGMRSLDKHYGWEREQMPVEDIDVPF